MKITRKNMMLSLLTMLLMSGCNWLEVSPSNEVNEKNLDLRNALNGIYLKLSSTSLYGSNLSYGFIEVLAQRYLPKRMNNTSSYYKASKFLYDDADVKSIISNIWSNAYNGVASCNHLIHLVTESTPEDFQEREMEQKMIHGEALALRALFHFDILRMFAPSMMVDDSKKYIPYVDEYPVITTTYYSNTEILEKIKKDLLEARKLVAVCDVEQNPQWMVTSYRMFADGITGVLPDDVFFAYRGYRMNYYAITALLARVYLWEKDYKQAYDMANEVIEAAADGRKFFGFVEDSKLENDMKDSENIIFTASRTTLQDEYKPYTLDDSQTMFLFKKSDIFDEGSDEDKRGKVSMLGMSSKYGEEYSRKYLLEKGETGYDMIPILRLSEMYYIAAEYNAQINKFAEAKELLTTVRQKRGIMTTSINFESIDGFYTELIREVRKEQLGEGQLYFLYKRLDRKTFGTDVKFVFDRPNNEEV